MASTTINSTEELYFILNNFEENLISDGPKVDIIPRKVQTYF